MKWTSLAESEPIHYLRQFSQSSGIARGESRTVEVGKIQVTVRFVGRKGRRARVRL